MDLLAMHGHYVRELKSRKDCKYCTRVSKLVYNSRRSMCCIGLRCKGAMPIELVLSKVWKRLYYRFASRLQRWGCC